MEYTKKDKIILKTLSEDSRSSITKLAKVSESSRVTIVRAIDRLSKQLDLRFTLEIDADKLGLNERYLVAVKLSVKPNIGELETFFKTDKFSQSVYLVSGKFDLLIYVVANSAVNYIKWETHLAEYLSQYGATIMSSRHVFTHFGFIPMNESFTDYIEDNNKLDKIDKNMLEILNRNSRVNYHELGQLLNISEATARYRLFRLIKKEIITRFTIAAQKPNDNYNILAYFINYIFTKTTSSVAFSYARNSYMDDDNDSPMFNTFQLIFPITGRFRSFGMVLCKDRKTAFEKAVSRHKRIFKNERAKIIYGEIIKPIKGIFPFRNLDIRTNYRTVSWHELHV